MSHEFYVGQKVVCVDDRKAFPRQIAHLKKGAIYTVRWCGPWHWGKYHGLLYPSCNYGLRLVGIDRITLDGWDVPYSNNRFRPLEEQSKATELFRRIAQGVTDGRPIVPDPDYTAPQEAVRAVFDLYRQLSGGSTP